MTAPRATWRPQDRDLPIISDEQEIPGIHRRPKGLNGSPDALDRPWGDIFLVHNRRLAGQDQEIRPLLQRSFHGLGQFSFLMAHGSRPEPYAAAGEHPFLKGALEIGDQAGPDRGMAGEDQGNPPGLEGIDPHERAIPLQQRFRPGDDRLGQREGDDLQAGHDLAGTHHAPTGQGRQGDSGKTVQLLQRMDIHQEHPCRIREEVHSSPCRRHPAQPRALTGQGDTPGGFVLPYIAGLELGDDHFPITLRLEPGHIFRRQTPTLAEQAIPLCVREVVGQDTPDGRFHRNRAEFHGRTSSGTVARAACRNRLCSATISAIMLRAISSGVRAPIFRPMGA